MEVNGNMKIGICVVTTYGKVQQLKCKDRLQIREQRCELASCEDQRGRRAVFGRSAGGRAPD